MRQMIPGLQKAPSFILELQQALGDRSALCHHDNISSMSEWVYTLHLVILSEQRGTAVCMLRGFRLAIMPKYT